MSDITTIILLTFLPFLELRASIPYGVVQNNINSIGVFFIAVMANFALAVVLYFFLDHAINLFLKISWINTIYQRSVVRSQKKVKKYVERYGLWGLALFIGIPLPGSGVYTGALAAYTLGFSYQKFLRAALVGVLIAGVVVTFISVSGNEAWKVFLA